MPLPDPRDEAVANLVGELRVAGKLAVQFTIDGGRGHVTGSQLASSDLDDPDVEDCMVKAPTRWKFPKSADGDDVTVTYPFVLSPG